MSENKNKIYTAGDIERYHKNQMSPQEMHALEKAALDDPFLADAIEGYSQEAVNASGDISFLQDKLKHRIAGASVIELKSNRRTMLWKAAAAIIIIVGSGILINQFGIKERPKDVAKVEEPKDDKPVNKQLSADTNGTTITTNKNEVTKTDNIIEKKELKSKDVARSDKPVPKETRSNEAGTSAPVAGVADPSPITRDTLSIIPSQPSKDVARSETSNPIVQQKSIKKEDNAEGAFALNKPAAKSRQLQYPHNNVFRGQVLDANYNALPFANITSTQDKIGTYADAKGNFILTSEDSILNVQIKSVGYENNVASLRNDLAKNQVILQEDTKNLNEIVIVNKKSNSNRKKIASKVEEEPEPEDGWENYDKYIVNNVNIPDELQIKSSGLQQVEISFNVNKNGEPINIKVEKSLCKECDREAIRLLKEGPKWKGKSRKSRGTVTVPF